MLTSYSHHFTLSSLLLYIEKALICLKTRNGIVFSPHPRTKKSTAYTAKLVLDAAVAAGAPKDIIGWISKPTLPLSQALMHHPKIDLILATGGPSMVKAAYSSAKPAIGVGAGNTPVVVDETADVKRVVSSILMSKTFDNGVVCASEQSCIVVESIYEQVKERFIKYGGYFLSDEEADKVRKVLFINGALNAKIVGQSALKIADLAGVTVPPYTKVLIGEGSVLSEDDEFAHEKLSPTLGMYRAKDFYEAVDLACKAVAMGGVGHTSCLYTDQDKNGDRIKHFGKKMKTARILLNMPTSHGGIGDLYNFALAPSLTLGCGSWGGNSISENVGPKHLINKKTVAKREENMLWHKLPPSVYFRRGAMATAMEDLKDFKRACIVTDKFLFNHTPYVHELLELLKARDIECQTFYEVQADPTLTTIRKGTDVLDNFDPGKIIDNNDTKVVYPNQLFLFNVTDMVTFLVFLFRLCCLCCLFVCLFVRSHHSDWRWITYGCCQDDVGPIRASRSRFQGVVTSIHGYPETNLPFP